MKRISPALMLVVLLVAFGAAVSAQEEMKVRGTVVGIDTAAKSITLKPAQGAEITIVMDDAKQLSKVKKEDVAEVRYVAKDGVNTGRKLRKIIEGCQ